MRDTPGRIQSMQTDTPCWRQHSIYPWLQQGWPQAHTLTFHARSMRKLAGLMSLWICRVT